jgi:hypothetical protein
MRVAWIFAIALVGCASADTVTSWEGRQVDSLIFAWGPPMQDAKLGDGRRVLSYSGSYQIEATTYYCNAIFRADPMGQIVETNIDGNLGGCNRLLSSKPAAQ